MKTEKLKTYYLIIGMVCLCFLTASVGFTFYSMEEYEKKDISHFKENVESMRNSVSNMIKGNIEILDGMALTIGQMEITDIEHLQPIIKKVNDRNAFLQMGFVDADGTGDMVDLDGRSIEMWTFPMRVSFKRQWEERRPYPIPSKMNTPMDI